MREVIHASIFDPTAPAFFKSDKNDKARCNTISCENKDNCGLYKRGECLTLSIFASHCPYGNFRREHGFTRKAAAFRGWVRERQEQYADVIHKLKMPEDRMSIVGEYIFLPYPFMNLNESAPFLSKGGFLASGSHLMKLMDFTVSVMASIISFKPQALMGGEITDYQKKSVPLFVKHLSEQMPEKYAELCEVRPEVIRLVESFDYKGRKAFIHTIRPGSIIDGWYWDGEYLTNECPKPGFYPVSKINQIRIRPIPESIVTITNNDQVTDKTQFVS